MPSFVRIAADQKVEAVYVASETTIVFPWGSLKAPAGSWVVYDYMDHAEILTYDDFKLKYDIDVNDPNSTAYFNTWKPFSKLTGLEPQRGVVGSTVYISGSYFAATQGTANVIFGLINQKTATITSWSDTLIVCTVPSGLPTDYPVHVVVVKGPKVSNALDFQVT